MRKNLQESVKEDLREIKVITNIGCVAIYNIPSSSKDINKEYLELLTKSVLKIYKGLEIATNISVLDYIEDKIYDLRGIDFRLDFEELTSFRIAPGDLYKGYKGFIDKINTI